MITGTALIAVCMALGTLAGNCLGALMGTGTEIGGVGFSMLLLLLAKSILEKHGKLGEPIRRSAAFWRGMYIPVVVAMACTQNVVSALSEGLIAVVAGVSAVAVVWLIMVLLMPRRKGGGDDARK